jgi:hypothetical protein
MQKVQIHDNQEKYVRCFPLISVALGAHNLTNRILYYTLCHDLLLCSMRRDVIARFVVIGGIDDNHCLHFLFTKNLEHP